MFLPTHLFKQQIFTEHLLCVQNCSGDWDKQDKVSAFMWLREREIENKQVTKKCIIWKKNKVRKKNWRSGLGWRKRNSSYLWREFYNLFSFRNDADCLSLGCERNQDKERKTSVIKSTQECGLNFLRYSEVCGGRWL